MPNVLILDLFRLEIYLLTKFTLEVLWSEKIVKQGKMCTAKILSMKSTTSTF